MKIRRIMPFALALCALTACGDKDCAAEEFYTVNGVVWNTDFHVVYCGIPELADSIMPILNEIGSSLSVFDPNSVVSEVNRSQSATVDSHFAAVYNASKSVWRLSGGRFDPTLAPLIDAWGFGPEHSVSADTARIDSIRQFVGLSKTSLNGMTLSKEDPRTQFNFSAIAKGYGCDMLAEMFQRNGICNYLIEIGGEIRCDGFNESGFPWTIQIEPVIEGTMPRLVRLNDCGAATSGNYRNTRVANGTRFGHTISAADGHPVQTDILSATVLAPIAMEADALATACMTMTSAEALALCDSARCTVILQLADSSIVTSPGRDCPPLIMYTRR